jgi:hypothetical protein
MDLEAINCWLDCCVRVRWCALSVPVTMLLCGLGVTVGETFRTIHGNAALP